MSSILPFEFDAETTPRLLAPGEWQMTLTSNWNINNNPNGGYIIACLLQAMRTLVPDNPDPVAVTTHYLRPGLSDQPAVLTARLIRSGRRTSTVCGTLIQDGKERITSIATFSDLSAQDPVPKQRALSIEPPLLPAPEDCVDRQNLGQGVSLPLLSRVQVRVDPKYAQATPAGVGALTGWIRFNDKRPPDVAALLLFTDAFAPSVFSLYGPIGWVPTLELSVHVRRRPTAGWIKASFTVQDVAGELFIEDGILWDEQDRLVAQSRQLQMILN